MKRIAGILCFAAACSMAQTKSAKVSPIVPVELREKFFKAQSEYQLAAANLREMTTVAQEKNAILTGQIEKIKDACGKEFSPSVDKDGEIICVENTKATDTPKAVK